MNQKDTTEKMLADYNDVFADVSNVLLFKGNRLIKECDLQNTKDKSQYKADGKIHEQERDLSKVWKQCNIKLAMIGMENQTDVDSYMPLRVIGYDGAVYRSQYPQKKDDKTNIYPVITMILYFGRKKWDKATCLSDIMKIPEELKPFFQDYHINVFNISYLTDEQVSMFQSDFRIVANHFVQMRRNPEHYIPDTTKIKHVDAVLKLMKVLTGDERYEEVANEYLEKGGELNMCEILDRYENRGIAKGRAEGLKALVQSLRTFCPDLDTLYKIVIKNETYSSVTKDELKKYL